MNNAHGSSKQIVEELQDGQSIDQLLLLITMSISISLNTEVDWINHNQECQTSSMIVSDLIDFPKSKMSMSKQWSMDSSLARVMQQIGISHPQVKKVNLLYKFQWICLQMKWLQKKDKWKTILRKRSNLKRMSLNTTRLNNFNSIGIILLLMDKNSSQAS